jgi:hypothetical protein
MGHYANIAHIRQILSLGYHQRSSKNNPFAADANLIE